jgi:hypothetical protein
MKPPLVMMISITIFILGIYFVCSYPNITESFKPINNPSDCPNILLQQGNKIFLFNNKKAYIPGVNPIQFDNLEDYVEFMNWQKSQNIRCPVLYLQKSFDPQGLEVYKIRPSFQDPQPGLNPGRLVNPQSLNPFTEGTSNPTLLLDANHSPTDPFNKNSMPGYDPSPYYVGTTTPLDKMDDSNLLHT